MTSSFTLRRSGPIAISHHGKSPIPHGAHLPTGPRITLNTAERRERHSLLEPLPVVALTFRAQSTQGASNRCDAGHLRCQHTVRKAVPTITIRHVRAKVVQFLKALARRHNRSMEHEVREAITLAGYVAERRAVLDQIKAGWTKQARRPTAAEIDSWRAVGRP